MAPVPAPPNQAPDDSLPRRPRRLSVILLAVYWPALALATHWPRLRIDTGVPLPLDKLLHFAAFVILTFLLTHTLAARSRLTPARLTLAGLIALAYAVLDEWTQRWIPGRSASWLDTLVNVLAILSTVLAIGLHQRFWSALALHVTLARLSLCLLIPFLGILAFGPPAHLENVSLLLAPRLGLVVHADKLAHFLAAALLLFLLTAAAPFGRHKPWLNFLTALVLVCLASPIVEYLQLLRHRNFELLDIAAHQLGLAAATLVILFFRLLLTLVFRPRPAAGFSQPVISPANSLSSPAPAAPTAAAPATTPRFVGHAATVSVLTLLSRLTGLVRDAYLSSAFGLSGIADAFWFGFAIPNLFRRLFGEGALTAAFIPVYTRLIHQNRPLARRFAWLCISLTLLILGTLTLAGETLLWGLLRFPGSLSSPGWSDDAALAIRLTMLMLPYMPLVCLVALFGAVLQVHGRFAPAASMPILLNLVMIAATAWATWSVSRSDSQTLRSAVQFVAVFVVVAGLVQVFTQLTAMLRYESFTPHFAGTAPYFRQFLSAFLPTFVALSVFQINTFLDQMIAMALSPKTGGPPALSILGRTLPFPIDAGGLAALNCAQRLYQFPLGVFGIAIATAIFPALAQAAAQAPTAGRDPFRQTLQQGLRLTVFIGLPATVGLILAGFPIVRLLFERGQFTLEDSHRVTFVLMGYAPAIWAYSMTHLLTRAFYALRDARTPMIVSFFMVGLNLLLNLLLVWPLGAAGLAWSTALCAIIQCLLLLTVLSQTIPRPIDRDVLISWAKTALLCLLMAAALTVIILTLNLTTPSTPRIVSQATGLVVLGMAIFLAGAWFLGCEELTWLRIRRVSH